MIKVLRKYSIKSDSEGGGEEGEGGGREGQSPIMILQGRLH